MTTKSDSQLNPDLAALIGSRICHDLISPVGAISNGLELLTLAGTPSGPEMNLLRSSADYANARLRFFRVAFGLTGKGQTMPTGDVSTILDDVFTGNISIDWRLRGALDRPLAQASFLALMCTETALPYGGHITISGAPDAICLVAEGERLSVSARHWDDLAKRRPPGELSAALVQFALLPEILTKLHRRPTVFRAKNTTSLQF
ncbi:histidine phosphotransferase family protein [Roseovarius pelagicus]|uniref:Histidine phosphotransferase family protein n=1 Tax=Roseovarius pelagicus TaxID=2980108 RepID=A0ABY6DJC6_9RHOB|nr:histidine phosphotransferase family protein [Roseovarius pelagicus]UXX83870.1 histidine phosphotransferase family protein [Roseovarius pelagicus]